MSVDVLIVDDDSDMRNVLCELLRDEGLSVLDFTDATELAAAMDTLRPRLVLLDLTLPGTNLREVLSDAAQRGCRADVTILAVSGLTDAEDVARDLGLDGVIPKPFDLASLIARAKDACRPAALLAGMERTGANP